MSDSGRTVRLYFAPQSFPCGPESACCGPVGQSPEELSFLTKAVTEAVPGVVVETIDVSKPLRMDRDLPVIRLLNSFGQQACPIFTVGGEVVSMGPPVVEELGTLLHARLRGGDE